MVRAPTTAPAPAAATGRPIVRNRECQSRTQMSLNLLVEMELTRHDWSRILQADGPAIDIPGALRDLVNSKSPDESKTAYWKLENHIVVQSQLFEAARYIVPALCAGLVQTDRPKWVRIQLLELLFQVVSGESAPEERTRGNCDLGDQCRTAAREGLWVLYRIFQERELGRAAKEIIERIDQDPTRLGKLQELNRLNGRVDNVEPLKTSSLKI